MILIRRGFANGATTMILLRKGFSNGATTMMIGADNYDFPSERLCQRSWLSFLSVTPSALFTTFFSRALSIALRMDIDNKGMVNQTVNRRDGHHVVGKNGIPLAERLVGGN